MATCLGLSARASSRGRPACLSLDKGPEAVALVVDAVLGHGSLAVHSPGPLLAEFPWLLGVSGDEGHESILVIDPWRLPRRFSRDHPTGS